MLIADGFGFHQAAMAFLLVESLDLLAPVAAREAPMGRCEAEAATLREPRAGIALL